SVTAMMPLFRPVAFGKFIGPEPAVSFAAFAARAHANPAAGAFSAHGTFTPGAGLTINPATDKVTVKMGSFSITIPAGSFQQRKNGDFVFKGVIKGIPLDRKSTRLNSSHVKISYAV